MAQLACAGKHKIGGRSAAFRGQTDLPPALNRLSVERLLSANPSPIVMQRYRYLAWGAYLVGAALILFPVFDAFVSIFPLRFGEFRWRYGASAMLANAFLIPNAGLLVLLATAISYGHATFRRVLGVVAIAGAVTWLVMIGMFALDSIQTRAVVHAEMLRSFSLASWSAVGKMLLSTATMLALGLAGFGKPKGEAAATPGHAPLLTQARETKSTG
jgi:hypothetical protein